jgi:Mg2+ and Co2+ transporter CorA
MRPTPPPGSIRGDSPFLWILAFDESGRGAQIPATDAPPVDGGALIWTHINVADLRGQRWIDAQRAIPADARAMLAGSATQQRLQGSGETLWGALVDYAQDFGQDIDQDSPSAQDLTQLRFAAGPGYLVTTRRRPSRSAASVLRLVNDGKSFHSAFDLVDAIVDQSMQAMDRAVEELAEHLNDVEDRVLGDEMHDERQRLGVLRRALIRVHREINSAQRMVSRFDPLGQCAPAAQAVVQRLALRLDSCNQEAHSTEQRARLLQDEIVSKLTAETNRQLYILTTLSLLLLPPTLVAGIFGMNVKGLPFTDEPGSGFLYAVGACAVSALLAWLLLLRLDHRPPPAQHPGKQRARKAPDRSPEIG